jgi:hypothetical protein
VAKKSNKTKRRVRELDTEFILSTLTVGSQAPRTRTLDSGITLNGQSISVRSGDDTTRSAAKAVTGVARTANEHIAKIGPRAGKPKLGFITLAEALRVAADHGNHNPDAAYRCSVCGKWHIG